MNDESRYLWLVRLDYDDPNTEAEWNGFYNSVHLKDILSLPGVVRISRYECIKGRRDNPRFLSITEIAGTDNLAKFISSPEAGVIAKSLRERFPASKTISRGGYQHIITVSK